MVQYLKQGDIWGRVGSGIGQGLAQQLPEEIQRGRLAQGLQQLSQQKGLSPFQQFAGLASLPGTNPQIVQSGSDILRQQAYLDSLKNQYDNKMGQNGYMPSEKDLQVPVQGEIPTLADTKSTEESYKSFIPPTEQQERMDAYKNFQSNPARYNYNFENALNERKGITARNKEIQEAYQKQERTALGKETTVKQALDTEIKRLGLNNIPPKSYQKFEEKILNAVLSKKDGGEGLTQEQAIKKYSDELGQVNRDNLQLENLSPWSPDEFDRQINSLQKNFSSRNELQQMMDKLISEYQLSPLYAAHRAYPVKSSKALKDIGKRGYLNIKNMSDLKNEMGKSGSPLSISYELVENGIDPTPWLKYLDSHRDDLEGWQIDQLSKNANTINLKDIWLRAWEK